jgi:arginase family enzyme
VEVVEMKDWQDNLGQIQDLNLQGPVYISFDMDALDPSVAPGVSHHEPGGFRMRQVLKVLQSLEVDIVGADIVEYNPKQDINNMTAYVAAKLFKELLVKMTCENIPIQ